MTRPGTACDDRGGLWPSICTLPPQRLQRPLSSRHLAIQRRRPANPGSRVLFLGTLGRDSR